MSVFRKTTTWLVAFSFLVLAGCATIFTGSSNSVTIHSEPAGGKVYINGNYMGNTPATLTLKRDKDYNIMVKKDGYDPANATITRSFNAISILNLTSPICWLVDIITGAMWKFDTEAATVTLEKTGAKSSMLAPSERIIAGKNMKLVPYKNKTAVVLENEAQ